MSASTERHVGASWFAWFSGAWLVVWAVQLTPVQLLIPLQLDTPDDADGWVRGVVTAGIVLGVGGAAGLIAGPWAGALSDRTRSSWGRRRVWILIGTAITVLALVGTAFADGVVAVGAGWIGVSVGIAITSSALTALIADQLDDQRGAASAAIGSSQALGIIVGVALVTLLGLSVTGGYLVLAALMAVTGVAAARALPDPPPVAAHRESGQPAATWRSGVAGTASFGWLWAGRLIVNIGNGVGTGLLFFFLLYGLDRDRESAEIELLLLIVVYTVCVVVSSIIAGSRSDHTGRRHGWVMGAAFIQACAAFVLAISPTFPMAFVSAAMIGVGYGAFMSVGLALATDLLAAHGVDSGVTSGETNADAHARDLGLVNVSANLGQLIGPLLGASLVAWSGGFSWVFAVGAMLSVVGGLMTRGVRIREQ